MPAMRHIGAEEFGGEYIHNVTRSYWSIVRPYHQEVTNLCTAPGAEIPDVNGQWEGNYGTAPVVRVSPGYAGAYAYKVTPAGFASVTTATWGDIDMAEGERYYVVVAVKAISGSFLDIGFISPFSVPAGPGVPIGGQSKPQGSGQATGQWQLLKMEYHSNSDLEGMKLAVRAWNDAAVSVDLYVDALTITRGIRVDSPFDGDDAGASWSGVPHASTSVMSRFARGLGEEVRLSDIGFHPISYMGAGMPPVRPITQKYGLLGGAYYQRSIPDVRTLTLIGVFVADGARHLHAMRAELESLLLPWRYAMDGQAVRLYGRIAVCDTDVTAPLCIDAVYENGLEGEMGDLYGGRAAVQFMCPDPFWVNPRAKGVEMKTARNASFVIDYRGTAPAPIVLRVYGGTAAPGARILSVRNVTQGVTVDFSADGGQAVGVGEQVVLHTDPRRETFMLYPAAVGPFVFDPYPGPSNVLGAITPQSQPGSLRLLPGRNEMEVSMGGWGASTAVSISWNELFWSFDSAPFVEVA